MYQNKFVLTIPKNKENFFSPSIILLIASIVISIISIIASFQVKKEIAVVVWLPIIYSLLFLFIRRKMCLTNPGVLTLNAVAFMRYAITPMVMILTGELNNISITHAYMSSAVAIMAFEMVSIFITILVYNPKSCIHDDEVIKNRNMVKILAILAAVLIVIDNRSFIGNLSISTGLSSLTSNDVEATSGITTILWQTICVFIFCLAMRSIYESKKGRKQVLLSLLTCLAYLLVIYTGQVTISRWYTIVTLIAAVCWLIKLYPKKTFMIVLMVVIPTGIVLAVATILKNTTVGLGAGFTKTIFSIFNSTNMDTYFAGPVNVNTAIAVKESTGLGIGSIIYDVFNNFPYINHLIDRKNASVSIFNQYLGRGDQIIPLVGQSFSWFGYVFTPLLSIFFVMMVKKADAKFSDSNSITTYLYAFFSVWCALMPILNATIWMSWMYSRIIPAFVLFKIVTRKKTVLEVSNGR